MKLYCNENPFDDSDRKLMIQNFSWKKICKIGKEKDRASWSEQCRAGDSISYYRAVLVRSYSTVGINFCSCYLL